MNIGDLIVQGRILFIGHASDKAQLIAGMAGIAAASAGIDADELVAAVLRREELGSTGLGGGVAIPHARVPGVSSPIGVLAVLDRPIDFDAIDGLPVGLVCLLALPDSSDALVALATVSRVFRQPEMISRLRKAGSPDEVHDLLLGGGS